MHPALPNASIGYARPRLRYTEHDDSGQSAGVPDGSPAKRDATRDGSRLLERYTDEGSEVEESKQVRPEGQKHRNPKRKKKLLESQKVVQTRKEKSLKRKEVFTGIILSEETKVDWKEKTKY